MSRKKRAVDGPIVALPPDVENVVDSRLTRSEAVELMLEEAREQVRARIEAIDEEDRGLQSLAPEELVELVFTARVKGITRFPWGNGNTDVSFSIEPSTLVPTWMSQRITRYAELRKELDELHRVQRALADRGRAKLTVMRQILEKTEEGRRFMKDIAAMSGALNVRLLGAASKERATALVTTITTEIVEE